MGTFKNQKDKVVGSAKEKLGEILNKDELVDEGRAQSEVAKSNDEHNKLSANPTMRYKYANADNGRI